MFNILALDLDIVLKSLIYITQIQKNILKTVIPSIYS